MLIVLNTSIQSVRLVSQLERSLGLLFPFLVCGYVKSGFSKQFWIIERKAARLLTKFLECFGTDQAQITHGGYQGKAMLVDE